MYVHTQFNGAKFHVNDDYSTEIYRVTFHFILLFVCICPPLSFADPVFISITSSHVSYFIVLALKFLLHVILS